MASYEGVQLNTPEVFIGKHPDSKVLVISNGSSTNKIMPHIDRLKDYFDVIISVNHGFKYFDDVIDYHMVTEKPSPTNLVAQMLDEGEYRKDVPRIINWKGIEKYSDRYNMHKIIRHPIEEGFDIRKYKQNGYEGMLTGKPNKRNMAVGSVTLSSIHLACMFGASEVYLIGADMIFKGESDHFYKDNQYRDKSIQDKIKPANRVHLIEIDHKGGKHTTTDYFKDSAECINEMIITVFKDIKVFDFSDGLITTAISLDVEEFFEQNGV